MICRPKCRYRYHFGLGFSTHSLQQFTMADEDQDIFDSLEREASDFAKVSFLDNARGLRLTAQDAEIDRICKAFTLDA
jgi:hypothetical protein